MKQFKLKKIFSVSHQWPKAERRKNHRTQLTQAQLQARSFQKQLKHPTESRKHRRRSGPHRPTTAEESERPLGPAPIAHPKDRLAEGFAGVDTCAARNIPDPTYGDQKSSHNCGSRLIPRQYYSTRESTRSVDTCENPNRSEQGLPRQETSERDRS